jgi:hypothetical protein
MAHRLGKWIGTLGDWMKLRDWMLVQKVDRAVIGECE